MTVAAPGASAVHAGDEVPLSVAGVTKLYPGTVALRGVDFVVRRGAVNVLVG